MASRECQTDRPNAPRNNGSGMIWPTSNAPWSRLGGIIHVAACNVSMYLSRMAGFAVLRSSRQNLQSPTSPLKPPPPPTESTHEIEGRPSVYPIPPHMLKFLDQSMTRSAPSSPPSSSTYGHPRSTSGAISLTLICSNSRSNSSREYHSRGVDR